MPAGRRPGQSRGIRIGGSPHRPTGKRRGKPRQTNPDRASSKSAPDGRRGGPETDWYTYTRDRRSEGQGAVR